MLHNFSHARNPEEISKTFAANFGKMEGDKKNSELMLAAQTNPKPPYKMN